MSDDARSFTEKLAYDLLHIEVRTRLVDRIPELHDSLEGRIRAVARDVHQSVERARGDSRDLTDREGGPGLASLPAEDAGLEALGAAFEALAEALEATPPSRSGPGLLGTDERSDADAGPDPAVVRALGDVLQKPARAVVPGEPLLAYSPDQRLALVHHVESLAAGTALRTVVSLDGDVTTTVRRDVAAWPALVSAHQASVAAAVGYWGALATALGALVGGIFDTLYPSGGTRR